MQKLATLAILLLTATLTAYGAEVDLDRTASVYLQPRAAYSFPSGYLANSDYSSVAASWRTDGYTLGLEVGYYFSNSTIGGIEVAYTDFPPKQLATLNGSEQDDSRVRIRRFSLFLKHQMISRGKPRPFIKLGYGYYDITCIAMPVPGTLPLRYREYSITGKPALSGGLGFIYYISNSFSIEASMEAVYLNAYSAAWSSSGFSSAPLEANLHFFPVFIGFCWHISAK